MTPDPLTGKRIVVLGMARQGKALARWLPKLGAQVVLSDTRPADKLTADIAELQGVPVEFALGGHPVELLDRCDVLCVSGGVPLTLPIIEEAFRRGIRVTNDAQLFLERCPAPTLGITGSAGKTTTTSLIGAMCRASGRQTWVGGNIGDVLLDVLDQIRPKDIVVMELSSFQLELMTVSPTVAAVLNVTPNHLDRHGTMDAYYAAKEHIVMHQKPENVGVFGYDDPNARRMSQNAPGRKAYFSLHEVMGSGAFLDQGQVIVVGDSAPGAEWRIVCPRSSIRLPGEHNILNTLAACAVAGAGGISPEAMRRAIESFTGVEHRQELVETINGVAWINNSIATAPERVMATLRSYSEPVVLLVGGRDKKLPWEDLAVLATTSCRAVIGFGEFGPQAVEIMRRAQAQAIDPRLQTIEVVKDLPEAVRLAREIAQPGDVVLLSPGGTSYDAYVDFAARGQHFRELVRAR
jgi:UDP-N-acetylmuramoylalanine--D-glutamate ligase